MNNYKFSVAMSVYKKDDSNFFDQALESILINQTLKPDEVVIVIDGPVPKEINNVINKYKKKTKKIKSIQLNENRGLGNALKIAVENSKYELIARMDSDDISSKTRFEEQISFFKNNNKIDIVGGDISEFIGDENNIIARRSVPLSDSEIKQYMKKRCAMNHVTVMFKKSTVLEVGGYQDWFYNEDYYLWIRMCLNNCIFANTGTTLVNVRVGEAMYQRRGGFKYFISERDIQRLMLKNNMIKPSRYYINVMERLILQVLLPNKMREIVFKKFARKSIEK